MIERTDPISQFLCLERGIQPSVEMPVALAIREGWPSIRSCDYPASVPISVPWPGEQKPT